MKIGKKRAEIKTKLLHRFLKLLCYLPKDPLTLKLLKEIDLENENIEIKETVPDPK